MSVLSLKAWMSTARSPYFVMWRARPTPIKIQSDVVAVKDIMLNINLQNSGFVWHVHANKPVFHLFCSLNIGLVSTSNPKSDTPSVICVIPPEKNLGLNFALGFITTSRHLSSPDKATQMTPIIAMRSPPPNRSKLRFPWIFLKNAIPETPAPMLGRDVTIGFATTIWRFWIATRNGGTCQCDAIWQHHSFAAISCTVPECSYLTLI